MANLSLILPQEQGDGRLFSPTLPKGGGGRDGRGAGVVESVFGYDTFRPLQEEIIANVLAKRDSLAVMPTGSRKCCSVAGAALLRPDRRRRRRSFR